MYSIYYKGINEILLKLNQKSFEILIKKIPAALSSYWNGRQVVIACVYFLIAGLVLILSCVVQTSQAAPKGIYIANGSFKYINETVFKT